MDHFRNFNDDHGHQAGDECLMQVARAVRELVRELTDMVARYGGEESLGLPTGTEAIAASSVADRVRESVEALEIPHPEGENQCESPRAWVSPPTDRPPAATRHN